MKGNDPLSLYFGCMSQIENMGGAGMLTLNADWSKGEIHPLVDRHRKILAGNMFLTTACEGLPLREDDLQSDEGSKETEKPQTIERTNDKLEEDEQTVREVEEVRSVKGSASEKFSKNNIIVQIILTVSLCTIHRLFM